MRGTHPSFVLSSYGLLLVTLPLLAGCGGAAPKGAEAPASSTAPREPEPTTVEEAQAQIDRAKQELAGSARTTTGAGATSPSTGVTSEPPPADATGTAPSRHETKVSADEPGPSPCASPCRAIASMRRAVTAICRIAGDTDARCEGAKQTLVDSESRVKTCGC
jgi:hypothetical protein